MKNEQGYLTEAQAQAQVKEGSLELGVVVLSYLLQCLWRRCRWTAVIYELEGDSDS